jgi:hypothetical protein
VCRREIRGRALLNETHGILVTGSSPAQDCPVCHGTPLVRKTVVRQARTLAHGTFQIHETEYVCKRGCRHPSGSRIRWRSGNLGSVLLRDSSVGYDVMVFVGIQRFLHHRQREEIRQDLARDYDVVLSTGETSRLAKLFLSYLEALHHRRRKEIRALLEQDGGWPLHIDATGEGGRGTLLVLYAGWRGWVLASQKIPTECAEAILPVLVQLGAWAGPPSAMMRDLGSAMIKACQDFREAIEGEFPILSCHYHFLADVGKGLLNPGYGELRSLFRKSRIRPNLGKQVRDLGRALGEEIPGVRQEVLMWLDEGDTQHRIPEGRQGFGVVRAIAQWVLDYRAESTGQDFPFVLPYLDFYDRCLRARDALDAFLRTPPESCEVARALRRLARFLDRARDGAPFRKVASTLRRRQDLFMELRETLKLEQNEGERTQTAGLEPRAEEKRIQDIEEAVEELTLSLRQRRSENGSNNDYRAAIDLVLRRLANHGESLWGHVIHLPEQAGGGIRLVERTNDVLENFFHGLKHGERRRSGRKILTQDFEALPPAAALAQNLDRPDYVVVLCGCLAELPSAFAELDAEVRKQRLAGNTKADFPSCLPEIQTATASLPLEDRRIIRHEAMDKRIGNAAGSQTPDPDIQRAATG